MRKRKIWVFIYEGKFGKVWSQKVTGNKMLIGLCNTFETINKDASTIVVMICSS